MDCRNEKIGYKIREARNERVLYMIILGEKEEKERVTFIGEYGCYSLVFCREIFMKKLYQSYKLIILPYCVKMVANCNFIFSSKLFLAGQG